MEEVGPGILEADSQVQALVELAFLFFQVLPCPVQSMSHLQDSRSCLARCDAKKRAALGGDRRLALVSEPVEMWWR